MKQEYIQVTHPCEILLVEDLGVSLDTRKRIEKEILALKDSQNKETNVKADMSTWALMDEIDIFEIQEKISPVIDEVSWNMPPISALKDGVVSYTHVVDCWSAVYRKGDYTQSHDHGGNVGSFVYYLKAENTSPLVFDEAGIVVNPTTDSLVVFPSYLKHSVPKLLEDDLRIVISGNFKRTTPIGK